MVKVGMESKAVECNLCNSKNSEVLQEIKPYKIVKCKNCELIYLNPQPLSEDITKTYFEGYYVTNWGQGLVENKYRLRTVERFKRRGKLLDVGCGIGVFLGLARKNGWQVTGTELSEFSAKHIRDKLNIECFLGGLEDLESASGSYDVITLWHVIEHIPEPLEALKRAWELLSRGGMIFLATPNQNFWRIARDVKRRMGVNRDLVENEKHLYFFTAHSLKKILEGVGFKVIEAGVDFNKCKPKLEHFLKYYWFSFISRVLGVNCSKAMLMVGQKEN